MIDKSKYILLLLVFAFFSCAKEEFPEPNENDTYLTSVFKTEAIINGEEFLIEAGKSDYYLSTSFEEINEGDYKLTTGFYNQDCVTCNPQLKINLYSNTGKYYDTNFSDEIIRTDTFSYNRNELEFFDRVIAMSGNSSNNIEFAVVNGNYTEPDEFFKQPVAEPVILDYSYSNVNFTIDNDHWYSYNEPCEDLQVYQMNVFGLGYNSQSKILTITPPEFEENGIFSWVITWVLDGEVFQKISSDNEFFTHELDTLATFYNVNMSFESQTGDVIIQRQNHISPMYESFNTELVSFDMLNIKSYEAPVIEIEYIDDSGIVYSSLNSCFEEFSQEQGNVFEISDVSNYDNNANGERTLMVKFNSALELVNENGDIIIFEDFSGTIAFAIPE